MKSNVKNVALLCFAVVGAALPAYSATADAALCENAATRAAALHSIPPQILRTLTLTETGRMLNGALLPWPWAINHAGEGHWFASQDAMLAYADSLTAAGQRNFDIGCFQLNYRWHGHAFSSLEQMSDPETNAAYAAWFLRSKYTALGAWQPAVGAYHSRTEAHATAYLARFEAIFARWVGEGGGNAAQAALLPAPVHTADPADSINTFPLLIAGRTSNGGSLVPDTNGGLRLIGTTE